MKRILYGNLVGKSRPSLREEGEGDITTKAILDVDECVEGMRKFTTEVFDTGVGKSTLFKLLLGLYEPQEGEVLVGGIPAGQLTEKERRKWFGYVEQSYHMVPGTIRDQITLYDESITEEQSWQNRRFCFWMRLLQTWMPRRNTRCCRH